MDMRESISGEGMCLAPAGHPLATLFSSLHRASGRVGVYEKKKDECVCAGERQVRVSQAIVEDFLLWALL